MLYVIDRAGGGGGSGQQQQNLRGYATELFTDQDS